MYTLNLIDCFAELCFFYNGLFLKLCVHFFHEQGGIRFYCGHSPPNIQFVNAYNKLSTPPNFLIFTLFSLFFLEINPFKMLSPFVFRPPLPFIRTVRYFCMVGNMPSKLYILTSLSNTKNTGGGYTFYFFHRNSQRKNT